VCPGPCLVVSFAIPGVMLAVRSIGPWLVEPPAFRVIPVSGLSQGGCW